MSGWNGLGSNAWLTEGEREAFLRFACEERAQSSSSSESDERRWIMRWCAEVRAHVRFFSTRPRADRVPTPLTLFTGRLLYHNLCACLSLDAASDVSVCALFAFEDRWRPRGGEGSVPHRSVVSRTHPHLVPSRFLPSRPTNQTTRLGDGQPALTSPVWEGERGYTQYRNSTPGSDIILLGLTCEAPPSISTAAKQLCTGAQTHTGKLAATPNAPLPAAKTALH